ncbi:hypothetical protein [Paenibacillus antarcticus]|uniref:Uncharacterized protein n=1 Tax=Paenibacillus antarcticus TaxID=253703 RepID=A0A162QH32_9BACL|nr:hypothetical protein [Paenibacillus antarcticus]OAB48500.1 hypothetical protein PBAT_02380 [Paenibacillus antarcticus]
MDEREVRFNNFVSNQAADLLNDVKSNVSTYGEVRENLLSCERSARWRSAENPYLLVITEAKRQLEKEIDATTKS